jgi:hypothetical protein
MSDETTGSRLAEAESRVAQLERQVMELEAARTNLLETLWISCKWMAKRGQWARRWKKAYKKHRRDEEIEWRR